MAVDAAMDPVVIRAEASAVLASMRLTTGRWMPQLRFERELSPELEHPLVCALRELSARAHAGAPADVREVLAPFVGVLASPHAHAPVLHATAASLSRFVAHGALARADAPARAAACALCDAVVARLARAELGGGALASADVLEPLAQRLLVLLTQLPSALLPPSTLCAAVRAALAGACSDSASLSARVGAEGALLQLTRGAFGQLPLALGDAGARGDDDDDALVDTLVDNLASLLGSLADRATQCARATRARLAPHPPAASFGAVSFAPALPAR